MRRPLNILTALSLLLCVAVLMVSVRSYWRVDTVYWHTYVRDDGTAIVHRHWNIASGNGGVWFEAETHDMTDLSVGPKLRATFPARPVVRWNVSRSMNQRPADISSTGFHASLDQRWTNPVGRVHSRTVRVPWWIVALPAAFLPVRYLSLRRRRRRQYRVAHALCPDCGYDLRASPGRCPECGTTTANTTL
jgi:hypothetical protein